MKLCQGAVLVSYNKLNNPSLGRSTVFVLVFSFMVCFGEVDRRQVFKRSELLTEFLK